MREFFCRRLASRLTLDDCDRYFDWRASGGYVPTFKVRGKQVTKRTRGGTRAVDLELTALSNALALAARRSRLKMNPIRERGAYSDKSRIRHWREMAPTPPELARIVDWMEKSGRQQPADLTHLALNDCDRYFDWRTSGGYVATFKVRSKEVTKRTRGGTRAVDLELTVLSNALSLAVRRGRLKTNPLRERGRYTDRSQIRHCRETAPTPDELRQIVEWLENNGHQQPADFAQYLAYSGLRIGEGLGGRWGAVNWAEELIHVKRSKKGLIPWVPILPEMKRLLASMKERASGDLMFPSVLNPDTALDPSAFRRLLAKACRQLGIRHVTPHGLRSYFVTQARQSGLTDAEIAQLIGDKTGPSIIAEVYGDVRPDHLLNIARKIQLTAATRTTTAG